MAGERRTALAQFSVQSLTSQAASGAVQEAEGCFLHAIEIARHQSAKSLELRAVMNLSRLWQSQGRREEARQILAEMYGWFAEGFDTEDLQEAKALLAAWSLKRTRRGALTQPIREWKREGEK